MRTPKQAFLDVYEREHATTMRVLRAYPPAAADLKPAPRSRSAREIAWTFALEPGLGMRVLRNEYATASPGGRTPPPPPAAWDELIAGVEKAHKEYDAFLRGMSDKDFEAKVTFLVGPKTPGEWRRLDFAWFLLHDEIHHRGQLSVYLRAAGGQVPSIYGPSGDEPWI